MEESKEPTDTKLSHQDLTLICVDSEELMRRISSLIERKREEVNAYNNREFLDETMYKDTSGEVCARTAAVYVKREKSKSHISVSRVRNACGPQISAHLPNDDKSAANTNSSADFGIEERLKNLESVANVKLNPGDRKDVTRRLRVLEDRVQFLLGISPEYFTVPTKQYHQTRCYYPSPWTAEPFTSQLRQDLTVEEIDDRIAYLKEALSRESVQYR